VSLTFDGVPRQDVSQVPFYRVSPSLYIISRLTVGSAFGSLRELFNKIKSIDAKHGKFDCVLCVGDFFGPLQAAGADSATTDELTDLLDGAIPGILLCYFPERHFDSPSSTRKVLHYAGRKPPTRTRY